MVKTEKVEVLLTREAMKIINIRKSWMIAIQQI